MSDRLREFGSNQALIAVRIIPEHLSGFLGIRRRYMVPPRTLALVHLAGGNSRTIQAGDYIPQDFDDAILIKDSEVSIPFTFDELLSSNSYAVRLTFRLVVSVNLKNEEAILTFCNRFLGAQDTCYVVTLKSCLLDTVRERAAEWASLRTADELIKPTAPTALSDHLYDRLLVRLDEVGLQLRRLDCIEIHCPTRIDEIRIEERMQRLRKIEEKKQEFLTIAMERLRIGVQALVEEECRKGISTSSYLDRIPGQATLRQMLVRELSSRDAVFEGLITGYESASIPILNRYLDEIVADVLGEIRSRIIGGVNWSEHLPDKRAIRILLACGRTALLMPPLPSPANIQTIEFPSSLRSVAISYDGKRPLLLAGARNRIYSHDLTGDSALRTYTFPENITPRGGANSMVIQGKILYATHSEFGVVRWELDSPEKPGTPIFSESTRERPTTRGVCITNDGTLWFSSGSSIFYASPDDADTAFELPGPESDEITSFCITQDSIYASTRGGLIVRWERRITKSVYHREMPIEIIAENTPIYSLDLVSIGTEVWIVFATRKYGIRALNLQTGFERTYRSGGCGMRLVASASGKVFGLSEDGATLLIWNAERPEAPEHKINLREFDCPGASDLFLEVSPKGHNAG